MKKDWYDGSNLHGRAFFSMFFFQSTQSNKIGQDDQSGVCCSNMIIGKEMDYEKII